MLEEISGGFRVHVYVQPDGRRSEILGEHDGQLKIRVQAPPVEGKANEEVEHFISEIFARPRKFVQIVKGQTSRRKVVEVLGLTVNAARLILKSIERGS